MKNISYKDMKFTDILNWCVLNGEKAWLAAKLDETRPGKPTEEEPNPEPRNISYIEVKRDFCEKFFPEKLPVAKPKPKSMRELLSEAL